MVGEKGREHAARDEDRAVVDPEPGQRAAHDGAFLRCWVRASMTGASAACSVRPVTVTPYATAVATHSRASVWWTSTSTFTRRKLTAERDRGGPLVAPGEDGVARGLVGERAVVLGGPGAAHGHRAHALTLLAHLDPAAA